MLTKENADKWITPLPAQSASPCPPVVMLSQEPHMETIPDSMVVPTKKNVGTNPIYYPAQKNSLFWSIFIGAYGMGEYMINERKYANVEMNERQKMLDYFRDSKNTGKLKQGNIKVSNVLIQEIMADIMVANRDPNSVFHMLIALSVFHKKTIYYVRKNKYLVFSYTDETDDLNMENTLLIYAKNDKESGLYEDATEEHIREIVQNKYRLVSYDKPLRGISTYKIPDLEEISRRLQIDLCNEQGIALKKTELYHKIWAQAVW